MAPAATGPKLYESAASKLEISRLVSPGAGTLLCFFITLAACLWQNVVAYDARANLVWDAAHYIDSCRDLASFLLRWLAGDVMGVLRLLPDVRQNLMLDGPVLPSMGALLFAALGRVPGQSDLVVFVLFQCLLQAVGAALVSWLAGRLTGSPRWGVCGGLAWGLYPAAVIGAGYFMSETVTTVMLIGLAWVVSNLVLAGGRPGIKPSFFAGAITCGALAALVMLTKPVLVLACVWAGLVALTLLRDWRHRCVLVVTAALGFAMVLAPWAAFTKSSGHLYLTPQRLPAHNVVMGFDTETDGVGASGAALDYLFGDADGPLVTAVALYRAQPAAVTDLLLRKPERLWSLPWNDLRREFFGVPAAWLVWWHRLLFVAGLMGAIVVLSKRQSSESDGRAADAVGWVACGVVLCHLLYVFFESIPRYGFTAMPFVVLLATFLLSGVVRGRIGRQRVALLLVPFACLPLSGLDLVPYLVAATGSPAVAIWLEAGLKALILVGAVAAAGSAIGPLCQVVPVRAVSMLLIALAGVAALGAHAANGNAVREWACRLQAGQSACREIRLGADATSPGFASRPRAAGLLRTRPTWAAVILDTDRHGGEALVSVNGKTLSDKPVSIYQYDASAFAALPELEQLGVLLDRPMESIRQWRAVEVPVSWLNLAGSNEIRLQPTPGSRVTIYGDYPPTVGRRRILSLKSFSPAKIWSSVTALEGRVVNPVPAAAVPSRSRLLDKRGQAKSDLSGAPGLQVGEYRLHLVLGYEGGAARAPEKQRLSAGGHREEPFTTVLPASRFVPPLAGTAAPRAIPGREMGWHRCEVPVGNIGGGGTVSIRLSGRARCAGSPAVVAVVPVLKGGGASEAVVPPGALRAFHATPAGAPFVLCQEVSCRLLKGGLSSVRIDVHTRADVAFQDLTLEIKPVSRPDFSKSRVLVY